MSTDLHTRLEVRFSSHGIVTTAPVAVLLVVMARMLEWRMQGIAG